jgi:hypothetical protein
MNFDSSDTALISIVALSSAVMAGLATFGAFDVSLSDSATLAGSTFSIAYLMTLGSFLVTVLTNDMPLNPQDLVDQAGSDLSDEYYYLLVISLGLLVAWPFFPGIEDFIRSEDLWGVLFIAASTGSQIAIGWLK